MALRNIIKHGDVGLTKKCKLVTDFNQRLWELLGDMAQTMEAANGVGLAAPQVGILRRVAIILNEEEEIVELINPEILSTQGEYEDTEGCLSVPGVYGRVLRPVTTKVKAQNRHGKWFEITGHELVSRALCHEIEHLDGHMFTERVTEYVEIEQ